jgi:hypothetical protein
MKTIIGKMSVVAAVASAVTLPAFAANNAALQSASRDVSQLTLLSGPNLTSGPRGAAPSGPTLRIAPSPQVQVGAANGRLTLSSEEPNQIVVPPTKHRLPKPESLKFDQKLHAPQPSPKMEFIPAPKRD